MDEQNIGLESQSAISEETNAGTQLDEGSATAPQEQNTDGVNETEGGTSVNDGGNEPPQPFMTVKHKHEDVNLSQEEATDWIQIGMASKSMLETVRRAAALKGVDVKTFIESFEKDQDEAYRQELIAKHGEDDIETVDKLMELYQSKKESTVNAAIEAEKRQKAEEEKTLEGRIADEFIELQKEFPDIKDFESLPKSVKAAASKGENLFFSYLRFQHSEARKAEAARKTAEAAQKASGGSLNSTPEEHQNSVMKAMMEVFSK